MKIFFRVFDGSSWTEKDTSSYSAGNSEDVGWRQFNYNNGNGTFGESDVGYCLWEIEVRNTGSYPTRTHAWVWAGGIGLVNSNGTTQVYDAYCKGKIIRGNGSLSLSPLVFTTGSATTGYRQQAIDHFNPDKARGTQILAAKEDVVIWPGYSFPT